MLRMIEFKLLELLQNKPGFKGKTYQEWAKKLGVSVGALHAMIKGVDRKKKDGKIEHATYNPSFKTLNDICRKLGVQPGDLLEYRKD